MNHADGDAPGMDDPRGVRQPLARLPGILVAPHRQNRGDGLQVVEDAQALQVAAVQDEINTVEDAQHYFGQVAAAAGGVSVRNQADFHGRQFRFSHSVK